MPRRAVWSGSVSATCLSRGTGRAYYDRVANAHAHIPRRTRFALERSFTAFVFSRRTVAALSNDPRAWVDRVDLRAGAVHSGVACVAFLYTLVCPGAAGHHAYVARRAIVAGRFGEESRGTFGTIFVGIACGSNGVEASRTLVAAVITAAADFSRWTLATADDATASFRIPACWARHARRSRRRIMVMRASRTRKAITGANETTSFITGVIVILLVRGSSVRFVPFRACIAIADAVSARIVVANSAERSHRASFRGRSFARADKAGWTGFAAGLRIIPILYVMVVHPWNARVAFRSPCCRERIGLVTA